MEKTQAFECVICGVSISTCEGCKGGSCHGFSLYTSGQQLHAKWASQEMNSQEYPDVQYLPVNKAVLHKASLGLPFWQNKPCDPLFSLQNIGEECHASRIM